MITKEHTKGYLVFWCTSGILLWLLLLCAKSAPINVDELLHNRQAKAVYEWFVTGGKDNNAVLAKPDNLRYYGQALDNIAIGIKNIFNLNDEFVVRHFCGAVSGWGLLLITGLLTLFLTGNYWIATLSMLLLFLSPRPFGQVFGNLKDLPFALGYMGGCYGIVRFVKELPKPTFKTTIILAFFIGYANSIRIGGLLLFFILALFVCVWFFLNRNKYQIKTEIQDHRIHYFKIIAILIAIGYFSSMLLWPYALQNPFGNPIKALSLMSHYSISIRQIFEGELYWSTHLPWYYLIKWLFISIPEIVWIGILLFVVLKRKTNQIAKLSTAIVAFCTIFPIVYVIAIDANLYSGWRQLYFFYPPFIVLCSIGLAESFLKISNNYAKTIYSTACIVLLLLPIRHIIKTYPNHYVYFNDATDILSETWSEYEYDYYFHGMKEAMDWLEANKDLDKETTIASNIDIRCYLPNNDKVVFNYVHAYEYSSKDWDYAIVSNNYIHPYQLKNDTWQPNSTIHTLRHNGNPYISILERKNNFVLEAMAEQKKGNAKKAIELFEKADERDKNNLQVKRMLASTYLEVSEFSKAENIIKNGLFINPFNEDLLFIKAKLHYKKEEYDESLGLMKKVFKLNSKYQIGLPLLENCYRKVGEDEKALKIRKFSIKYKKEEIFRNNPIEEN